MMAINMAPEMLSVTFQAHVQSSVGMYLLKVPELQQHTQVLHSPFNSPQLASAEEPANEPELQSTNQERVATMRFMSPNMTSFSGDADMLQTTSTQQRESPSPDSFS